MQHLMVDLEHAGDAILSIGAVLFNSERMTDVLDIRVDLQSSIDAGFTVNGATFYWWLEQSKRAREEQTRDGDMRLPLAAALQKLRQFIPPDTLLWGNGAASDNAILSRACELVNVPRLVTYQNDRCYRTVRAQYPEIAASPDHEFVAHTALGDARYQTQHLLAIAAVHPEVLR